MRLFHGTNFSDIIIMIDSNTTRSAVVQLDEPRHEKTNVLVSDLVRHKPGLTATEDG